MSTPDRQPPEPSTSPASWVCGSVLTCDHCYRDAVSGVYVVAGTYTMQRLALPREILSEDRLPIGPVTLYGRISSSHDLVAKWQITKHVVAFGSLGSGPPVVLVDGESQIVTEASHLSEFAAMLNNSGFKLTHERKELLSDLNQVIVKSQYSLFINGAFSAAHRVDFHYSLINKATPNDLPRIAASPESGS